MRAAETTWTGIYSTPLLFYRFYPIELEFIPIKKSTQLVLTWVMISWSFIGMPGGRWGGGWGLPDVMVAGGGVGQGRWDVS